jgi:raffinose/stachyose/melibiose transport system permease protein
VEKSVGSNMPIQNKVSKVLKSYKGLFGALPFLLPALIFYGVFVLYPMAIAIQLSFYKWNGFSTVQKVFVGMDNYRRVLTEDPVFWTATKNSLIWVGLSLLVPTLLGLVLALALNQNLPGRVAFRTILYLPSVLAPIVVATMWRWMYNPNYGVVNNILNILELGNLKQQWLGNTHIAIFCIFAAYIWIVTGLNMVLFLAGLQNIPEDLTDAAQVDGAGTWKVFRHVIVPALRPTFIIVFALTIINSLKVFDLVFGMTNGGPAQSTQVLALWSYYQSFGNHDFGQGNAIATILLGITLLIVVPYLTWTFRNESAR